jgi:hypothetical protein
MIDYLDAFYGEIQWRLDTIADEIQFGAPLAFCYGCGAPPTSPGCCHGMKSWSMTAEAYLKSLKAEYSRDETSGNIKITLDDGDGYKFELDTREKSVIYNRPVFIDDFWHVVSTCYKKDAMNLALEAKKQWEANNANEL